MATFSPRLFRLEPTRFLIIRSDLGRENHGHMSAISALGYVNRWLWVRFRRTSLFSFFELRVPHGFTQRGDLASAYGCVVSAILTRCCDDRFPDRDLSVVPETSPISKVWSAPPSFGLRTLSVSPKTPPRFKTPFGTANRNQPWFRTSSCRFNPVGETSHGLDPI